MTSYSMPWRTAANRSSKGSTLVLSLKVGTTTASSSDGIGKAAGAYLIIRLLAGNANRPESCPNNHLLARACSIASYNEENMTTHAVEIESGERFAFGENWAAFLAKLDEARIAAAENSLRQMLDVEDLHGKTFLDIGSGSGLFSLAGRRLGAEVTSFDYDPASVGCTRELKKRYYPQDDDWTVDAGSVLDEQYINSFPKVDIV